MFLCPAHCVSLVEEELHWVVVVCLERGEEYLVERMQALKLMKKFMAVAGEKISSEQSVETDMTYKKFLTFYVIENLLLNS